jgi:sulfur carrier protein
MIVTINGKRRECAEGMPLGAVMRMFSITTAAGIAVAVNERVVSRSAVDAFLLHEGDVVEIIRAVAGG